MLNYEINKTQKFEEKVGNEVNIAEICTHFRTQNLPFFHLFNQKSQIIHHLIDTNLTKRLMIVNDVISF